MLRASRRPVNAVSTTSVIGMNKRLFAPASRRVVPRQLNTMSMGSVTCANASLSCGSWGLNTPGISPNGRRVRRSNGVNFRFVNQHPQQVTAHQPRCACNPVPDSSSLLYRNCLPCSTAHAPGLIDHEGNYPPVWKFASSNATTREEA